MRGGAQAVILGLEMPAELAPKISLAVVVEEHGLGVGIDDQTTGRDMLTTCIAPQRGIADSGEQVVEVAREAGCSRRSSNLGAGGIETNHSALAAAAGTITVICALIAIGFRAGFRLGIGARVGAGFGGLSSFDSLVENAAQRLVECRFAGPFGVTTLRVAQGIIEILCRRQKVGV